MKKLNLHTMLRKTTAALLTLTVGMGCMGNNVFAANQDTDSKTETSYVYDSEYVSERISNNYSKVSAKYHFAKYDGEDIVYEIDKITASGELTADSYDYDKADKVLQIAYNDTVSVTIDVPKDGLYFVMFDYISYDDSVLPFGMGMTVDGEYPFYECRNLKFESRWAADATPSYDRYGNELVTMPDKIIEWGSKYLMDSSYRHSTPLMLELSAGSHELAFTSTEGKAYLGNITLKAPFDADEYTDSQTAEGSQLITIQGEKYSYTNDSSIHGITEYDTSLYPYEVKNTVINTIDSDSFDTAGQTVTYDFDVENAGYYYLDMNYRSSDKTDFDVFVDILVDGEIPNAAFMSYGIPYTTKYRTITLKDAKNNNLSVYLEEGHHTISYRISMDPICFVFEEIEEIMSGVNDLALEITKVAGTNSDKYRDLKLSKYIPDLESRLSDYAERLKTLEKECLKYSDSDKTVAVMSSMLIAAEQLISLKENPDEIPYRISELSTSTNSVIHYLATTIDNLIKNNLAMDRIYLYQEDAKLPKKPGFFKSLFMQLKRFFASFTAQAYSTDSTDASHLQVWVNRSSQYVQIMQKMIDESFTPQTGIEVDISIMPDQYKLVLSSSSGQTPDVATGINYTVPYELAIRNALVDMTQFEDFKEVAAPYEPGFFLTGTIGDSVYSMPETMNFWVLYYRSDVLDKLGLPVPDTMEEVIDMLPELQMRGLNFYYATAGMLQMRNFHGTTPIVMQNGGSLYYDTADKGTALGTRESVDGFTALTDLFTVYNLDVNVDNFYQHFRNGDLPIGIADFSAYNLLTNAAPELSGSWSIAMIPGTEKEDGTIDRTVCGCAESTVMFKSNSEREAQAWEFVKWWSSTEVQAEFGQNLQITYGDEYMWTTANMEAFDKLPWPAEHREIIKQTAANVVDIARVPGTYLLEREMSNAFNDVTVNGHTAQTRLDAAVKSINREIKRKLEEFGYIDSDGNVIREYKIPTIDSVKALLGRTDAKEGK